MDEKAINKGYEIEAIKSIEPFVKERLNYLVGDRRKWWASDFFDFVEKEDSECFKRLANLREEARGLQDEELVVLIGNEVTEEALPNYSRALANLFPDSSGISNDGWSVWSRGWEAEEKMHGRVLDRYLLLSGRVNQKAVDLSVDSLIEKGMENQVEMFRGLIYPAFQEPATALSHANMSKIAEKRGAETLYNICRKIAKDERRHSMFYLDIVNRLLSISPDRMMIAYFDLMSDRVIMPAMNMIDETYTEPPTLFSHFADVANKIGVYTSFDYADIVEKLNKNFQIAKTSVRDKAAYAQEYLCKLPNRIRRVAERTSKQIRSPVGFDWIYGQKA